MGLGVNVIRKENGEVSSLLCSKAGFQGGSGTNERGKISVNKLLGKIKK